jgi:hypothetical protein
MARPVAGRTILAMTTPTVTERPKPLEPVTPPTFVFLAVREGTPRPSASSRRIVD